MASHSKRKKKQSYRRDVGILISALAVLGVFVFIGLPHGVLFQKESEKQSGAEKTAEENASKPITLVFVGDIMMDRGVRRSIEKNFSGDYHALFKNTSYIKDADIAFANLEGPVGVTGRRVGSEYSFHMDPSALTAVRDAGFDIVSFANNHVGDYAQTGFEESLSELQKNSILYAGAGITYADATTPRIITVRGLKVGFLAATDVGPNWMKATDAHANMPAQPGILLATDPNLSNIITDAKAQVDVLVMSFHWGIEYSSANARQASLAHRVIDAGADIVVGAHPHVMQKTETYKGKPIFYSLGNFIFDQYFSPYTLEGMVGEVSIDPKTKQLTPSEQIVPLSKQFIPQALIPFDESMLLTKSFVP